jgi:hypothetical protein
VRRCDGDTNNVSREHVHHGRDVHKASLEREVREIGDPCVVRM